MVLKEKLWRSSSSAGWKIFLDQCAALQDIWLQCINWWQVCVTHVIFRCILIQTLHANTGKTSSRGHQDSNRCMQVFLQLQEVECRRPSHKLSPNHGGGSGTLRAWLGYSMALPGHFHLLAPSATPAGQTALPPWYLSEAVHNCCNSVIVIIFPVCLCQQQCYQCP